MCFLFLLLFRRRRSNNGGIYASISIMRPCLCLLDSSFAFASSALSALSTIRKFCGTRSTHFAKCLCLVNHHHQCLIAHSDHDCCCRICRPLRPRPASRGGQLTRYSNIPIHLKPLCAASLRALRPGTRTRICHNSSQNGE